MSESRFTRPSRGTFLKIGALTFLMSCSASEGVPVEVGEPCRLLVRPEGGRIELAGGCGDPSLSNVVLDIPAGAVDAVTELTVVRRTSLAHPDERAVGPALRLLPAGLVLKRPIQLELPYEPSAIAFDDNLASAVDDGRTRLANPLAHAVASVKRRPFAMTLTRLTDVQALIVPSPTLPVGGYAKIKYIDFLFVIDNSPSMEDKQKQLILAFPEFIKKILKCHADINIGIISTDIGTVPTGGPKWGAPTSDACNTENGLKPGFQWQTCLESMATPDLNCKSSCKGVRPAMDKFIHAYVDTAGNVTSNIPGTDPEATKVQDAFSCMAYLGATGCHIEQPLEAARRAIKADTGTFFRSKAPPPGVMPEEIMTVLVFLTDEDDCSIANRLAANAGDADSSSTDRYKNFGSNFRCFGMSTQCDKDDKALYSTGLKSSCVPKDYDKFLFPIDDLGDELTDFDGKMTSRRRLILAGLWSGMPVDVDGTRLMGAYGATPTPSPVELNYPYAMSVDSTWLDLKPNPCGPGFPGANSRPQHRLSHMAEYHGVLGSYQGDICDPGDYGKVLDLLSAALSTKCM